LKRLIKQKRPSQKLKSDYGMPSTRSAVILFIATYLMLIVKNLSLETKIFAGIFVLTSCYMKYHLKEHSIEQLLVGGGIGIITGYIIYKINVSYLHKR
tara:strand:+ start:129 stop:422 length:294 start_codon:yes stop_codon:yes gene_type:complete